MTVADTSILAYDELVAAGKVGAQAHKILGLMSSSRNYSRRELAKAVGIDLAAVCGRVNEMLAVGLLIEEEQRKCSITNRTINPVRTRSEDDTDSNLPLF